MDQQPGLIYSYDGSFDGFLCCVFESYAAQEFPVEILQADALACSLFPPKEISTDFAKARRVLASIPAKLGTDALDFIRRAFLTCLKDKELQLLQFLRLGFRHGPAVLDMHTDKVVHRLYKAVTHLNRESHLFKGFLRFSIFNNTLVGEIEPKNNVLPLLARHFCERYPEERFLIHDKTHGLGLIYQPYKYEFIPVQALELPEIDAAEQSYRELWQLFYDTIAIQGRYNPQCRRNHMPKRYWKNMTEFWRSVE
jgi:probable DNA metabolism protein